VAGLDFRSRIGVTDIDGHAVVEAGSGHRHVQHRRQSSGWLCRSERIGSRQADEHHGLHWSDVCELLADDRRSCLGNDFATSLEHGELWRPSNPGPVSFVAAPIVVVSDCHGWRQPGSRFSAVLLAHYGSSNDGFAARRVLMTVNYAGGRVCLPSSDTAVVVVAGPATPRTAALVQGRCFNPPRANFGFTVQQVMQGGLTQLQRPAAVDEQQ